MAVIENQYTVWLCYSVQLSEHDSWFSNQMEHIERADEINCAVGNIAVVVTHQQKFDIFPRLSRIIIHFFVSKQKRRNRTVALIVSPYFSTHSVPSLPTFVL
jgi:hypothetical protein